MRIQERLVAAMYIFQVYESTFFFFQIIPSCWAASLPWKWSKHPKCDTPVTTKYLIIATSFSGRLGLHLRLSLSNLEMTDWQRRLSAFLHEGRRSGGVCIISAQSVAILSPLCLFVSLFLVHSPKSTSAIRLMMPVRLQAPLLNNTALSRVMLVVRTLQFACDNLCKKIWEK